MELQIFCIISYGAAVVGNCASALEGGAGAEDDSPGCTERIGTYMERIGTYTFNTYVKVWECWSGTYERIGTYTF